MLTAKDLANIDYIGLTVDENHDIISLGTGKKITSRTIDESTGFLKQALESPLCAVSPNAKTMFQRRLNAWESIRPLIKE